MTRVYVDPIQTKVTAVESSEGAPGTVRTYLRGSTESAVYKSDIVQTTADSTGWRKPLPYSISDRKTQDWSSTVVANDHYLGVDGKWHDYQFHVVGDLSNLPPQHPMYIARPALPTGAFPGNLVSRAISSAYQNLKDQKVQYGVLLAESRKTAELVGSTAIQITSFYRAIRRGDFRNAAAAFGLEPNGTFKGRWRKPQSQKELANRWLEAQYGWLPLLSDIYGIYEDVRAGIFREARFSGKGRSMESSSNPYYKAGTHFVFASGATNVEFSADVRLDYKVNSEKLRLAASKGLTNPAEIAWELVPFSFVIDWFYPIGDYLRTLDADLGLEWKGGSYSLRTVKSVACSLGVFKRKDIPNAHLYDDVGSGSFVETYLEMQRVPFQTPPRANVFIKNPVSVGHSLNALALMRQTINYK